VADTKAITGTRQYLIPGENFQYESGTSQYLVGSSVLVNETVPRTYNAAPGPDSLTLTKFAPTLTFTSYGINVSKANAYAVTSPPPGINVAKANAYAVVFEGLQLGIGQATLSYTRYAPTLHATLTVGKASLSISGKAPSLTVSTLIAIGKAAIHITGKTPSLTATLPVGKAALAISGKAPAVGIFKTLTVGTQHLSIAGLPPTLSATLPIPPAALHIQGQPPALQTTLGIGTALLTLATTAPDLRPIFGFEPPTAALVLTGFRPVPGMTATIGEVTTGARLLGDVTIGDFLEGSVTTGRIPE
jgi:hypothetical protein